MQTPFEVIVVEDGSPDQTGAVIRGLTLSRPWLRSVHLCRNYGQHNALLCGIRLAGFDKIVTMDDDLQHPPEEIHMLLKALDEGADVVYGVAVGGQHGLLRDIATGVTKYALQESLGAGQAKDISAFRAFRTALREAFSGYSGHFVNIDVLLTWGSTRFAAVPVHLEPRKHGTTSYTVSKLVVHTVNQLTGFSARPLRLASMLGFFFTLCGMGLFAFVLGRYFISGNPVPGFPALAASISLFSGVQLFALGIIGEYLARIYAKSLDRPCYVVKEDSCGRRG